jgi:hypothetical protein
MTAVDKKISVLDLIASLSYLDYTAMVDASDPAVTKRATNQQIVESGMTMFAGGYNYLLNGSMRVAQQGVSFTSTTTPANSDDTYLLDQQILLSDGNDIVDVTQDLTVVPVGIGAAIKLEVETANKQFGIIQIIENIDSLALIGKSVSLSFQARMAAADDNTHSLKAVILSWSGTADAVTSDVVNAWGATPTYVASWTAENTPASNTLTTTYQTFKVENVAIDTANAKNVAVFIFCDQTDGVVDDAVYISAVKLELGAVATPYVPRLYETELALCKRHFERIKHGIAYGFYANGHAASTTAAFSILHYSEKRIIPTGTVSDVTAFAVFYNNALSDVISMTFDLFTTKTCRIATTTAAVLTTGEAVEVAGENSATTHWFDIKARL